MSSILSKWKGLRKRGVKFLANTFAENIASRIFDWLVVVAIGGGTLTTIFLFLRDAIWNPLKELLKSPIAKPQSPLTLFDIFLLSLLTFLLIIFGYLLNKYKREGKKIDFWEADDVKWEINKMTGEVKDMPYCKEHQAELIQRVSYSTSDFPIYRYYCPICGEKYTKGLDRKTLEIQDERIKEIAIAHAGGHLINFDINEIFKQKVDSPDSN